MNINSKVAPTNDKLKLPVTSHCQVAYRRADGVYGKLMATPANFNELQARLLVHHIGMSQVVAIHPVAR